MSATLLQRRDGSAPYQTEAWNRELAFIAWCPGCGAGHVRAAIIILDRRPWKDAIGYHDVPAAAVCSVCGTEHEIKCCENLFGDRFCVDCAGGPATAGAPRHIVYCDAWPGGGGHCEQCNAGQRAPFSRDDSDVALDDERAGD